MKITNITIVLIEPEQPGNIGAIARSMKNFDIKDLILVKPKSNHLSKEARNRAKWANNLLEKAKIHKQSLNTLLKKFHTTIGTTAKLGTDYNIPRSPIDPEQLSKKLTEIKNKKVAIVFGREGIGLTNEEIDKMDFIVSIPASKKYPTLNISQACTILFYELFKHNAEQKTGSQIIPASKIEKDIILKKINEILNKIKFSTKEKKQTQKIVWKRIIGKSFLTKREAFAVLGFLRKIKR